MQTYLYCADSSFDTARPVRARDLTPRCWFIARSRAEARDIFRGIEADLYPRGRRFGAAAIRQETARERARITPSPSELLPDCAEYLQNILNP